MGVFIIGLISGAITGVIIALFIAGATNQDRERDAYLRGYKDGEYYVKSHTWESV